MKLLFLHHQQRFEYTEEPGYNELFRPFSKCKQVTGYAEFVYQTRLRAFLVHELGMRGKKADGNPTMYIMGNLDPESYSTANLTLWPYLAAAIKSADPDLIVYSLTWPTEAIHPAILRRFKSVAPRAKLFSQQWDYEEGVPFFHSVEQETIAASDYFAICDNHQRLRRIRANQPPYESYRDVERVHWLPTVPDPDIYRPTGEPRTIDILVIGSSENHRGEIIAALRSRYGERFRHLGGLMPWDRRLTLADYVQAINQAKIVVNTQTSPSRVQLKGRVREVLSCGGFLLEEDNPESREFLAGSGVVLFDGLDDLFGRIDAYLEDDEAREQIARSAHEWYRARYTPDGALQQVIDALF